MKALPNLTALRFFLALFVVLFHIPQFCRNQEIPFFDALSIFHKGKEAVYVFFSLSGFLIIRQVYIEKKETGSISLPKFYMKRILRIFPLYYLILFTGFFYYRFLLPQLGYDFESNYNLLEGVLLSVFFLPNVFGNLYHPGGIIEILWSIGIEEQFYLFIAPVMLWIKRNYILPVLAGFTIVYFAVFFSDLLPQLYQFKMYFFYFSSSGLASVLMLDKKVNGKGVKAAALLLLVMMTAYFTTNVFIDNLSEMGYHLFSMILFAVFLSAICLVPFSFLEHRIMKYLGTISYGIYMFHAIAMQLVGLVFIKLIPNMGLPDTIQILLFNTLVIVLTILFAGISYRYYESYFLRLKKNFR